MKMQKQVWYFPDAKNHLYLLIKFTHLFGPLTIRIYGKHSVTINPVRRTKGTLYNLEKNFWQKRKTA
jgi:hypothetical protein